MKSPLPRLPLKHVGAWLALAVPAWSFAVPVTDAAGDFLPTFVASGGDAASSAHLDVVSANVLFNTSTSVFTLIATMNGAISASSLGDYVWGVDRGAGAVNPAFANLLGVDNVRFDRTVVLTTTGTGSAGGTSLAADAVSISGNTITAHVSLDLLSSTGFDPLEYTWNLWPRAVATATVTGVNRITDFAPDNQNFAVTEVTEANEIPEPNSAALLLAAVGALAGVTRRRKH